MARWKRGLSWMVGFRADTGDAVKVLAGGGLHPQAVLQLERARAAAEAARGSFLGRRRQLERAVAALDAARATMIETAR